MQMTFIKAIQIIIVAVSMAVGFLFYQHFQPEIFMMPEEEIIGTAEIKADPSRNYSGKTAGEGIVHLNGAKELEQLSGSDYVTITTKEIIATNVYGLKPWVNPYSLTQMRLSGGRMVSNGRRAAEATRGRAVRAEAYQEYYLIRLPDSGYCLAQVSEAYVRRLKKGEEVTLPIGKKQTTPGEAQKYLKEIGNTYGADTSYLLYMVDDEWGEANYFRLFLIRFGAAIGVFFFLSVGLLLLLGKIFSIED